VTDELEYRPGAILWTTAGFLIHRDWEPSGYHSTVSLYSAGKKIQEFDHSHFGIKTGVVIERPRLSPDGNILNFNLENKDSNGGAFSL